MSRRTNRGQSDFNLDNTQDDNVIRQVKSEPRLIKPAEMQHPSGEFFCPICHAVWSRKAWHTDERKYEQLARNAELARKCPACHKTDLNLAEGIVTLTAIETWPKERKAELLSLVRNIGDRARKRDPMDRIMKIMDKLNETQVYTTENQLAVAIGNEVKRAFGGDLNIDFSHRDNDIARVVWVARAA
jgi:NMD protein affecting ribosome stability and mRNA decay